MDLLPPASKWVFRAAPQLPSAPLFPWQSPGNLSTSQSLSEEAPYSTGSPRTYFSHRSGSLGGQRLLPPSGHREESEDSVAELTPAKAATGTGPKPVLLF